MDNLRDALTVVSLMKRIEWLFKFSLIALSALLVNEALLSPINHSEFAIVAGIAFISFLLWWLNEDTAPLAVSIYLWAALTLIFFASWNNQGLFDSAIYFYPCIIFLAIYLGSNVLAVSLFICMLMIIAGVYFAHETELLNHEMISTNAFIIRTIDLGILITMFFGIVYSLSKDLRTDIASLKKQNRRLKAQLNQNIKELQFDKLTQLPNQYYFEKKIEDWLTSGQSKFSRLAVVTIDIANMKQLNQNLGYTTGDQLLIELGQRLKSLLIDDENLYRINNNEFFLIKTSLEQSDIESFVGRIVHATSMSFDINGYALDLDVSVGVAVAPFDGETTDTLIQKARIALQHAKKNHLKSGAFYSSTMAHNNVNKFSQLTLLKQAIEQNHLHVYYQPKVNLTTGQIFGVEALVRWIDPNKGMIPPDQFIPLAEETGVVVDITRHVLTTACQDCKRWHQMGFEHLTMAVNISAIDFKRGNLPQLVFKALHQHELSPHYLELEITESTIFDDINHIQSQIHQMQQKGISFAIDDFGTGYSNLGYLHQFNVSTLKIDQSFIRKLETSDHHKHIIKAILTMSSSLGISNVAEGIENEDVVNWLVEQGCQFGQGYLWAKPGSFDEITARLKD